MRAFIWLIAATVMALTAPHPAMAQARVHAPATIPAVTPPPIIEPMFVGAPYFSNLEIHRQYIEHSNRTGLAFGSWRNAYDHLLDYVAFLDENNLDSNRDGLHRQFLNDVVQKNRDLISRVDEIQIFFPIHKLTIDCS